MANLGSSRPVTPAALASMMIASPFTWGSGKLGRPFWRRHFAHAATFVASKGRVPAAFPALPWYSRFWQAAWADLKVVEVWSTLLGMTTFMPPELAWSGSGKFETPCSRMHFA